MMAQKPHKHPHYVEEKPALLDWMSFFFVYMVLHDVTNSPRRKPEESEAQKL